MNVPKMKKLEHGVVLYGYLGTAYSDRHISLKRGLKPRHSYVRLPRDPRLKGRLVSITISLVKD